MHISKISLYFLILIFTLCVVYLSPNIALASGGTFKTMDDKVSITYYVDMDKKIAEYVKSAIEKAWPRYTEKSGKELEKLNLQVAHLMMHENDGSLAEPYGVTTFDRDTNICEITISTVETDKRVIQATTVHELMHCWQYDMNWSSYGTSTEWISEATAVWSEDWLYDYNTEFEYLEERFGSLNSDFFSIFGGREYGSYLYFKFLKQNEMITPEGVFALLQEHGSKTQEEVIGSQTDLHIILKEYALWNLNFDKFRKYKDRPEFKKIMPHSNSKFRVDLTEQKKYSIDFSMFRGGAKYSTIYIDDEINKLEFDTKEYNTLKDDNLSLQALVKIDGEYKYEDWSFLENRKFCRNRSSEKVDKIILFVNHSDLKVEPVMHSGSVPVDATGKCPIAWHGITIFKKSGGDGVLPMNEELIMDEVLEEVYNEDDGRVSFHVKEQTITVSGDSSTRSGCFFPNCVGGMGSDRSYSGTVYKEMSTDEEWPISRFETAGDKLVFTGTDQIYGECDYVTETLRTYADCSCAEMGSSKMDNTSSSIGKCHAGLGYEVEIPVSFIPGETTRIQGSTSGKSPAGHYEETIEWDYIYE